MSEDKSFHRMPDRLWQKILDGVKSKEIDLDGFVERFRDMPEPTEADLQCSFPFDLSDACEAADLKDCRANGTPQEVKFRLCSSGLAAAAIDQSEGHGWLYHAGTALAVASQAPGHRGSSLNKCRLEILPGPELNDRRSFSQCSLRISGVDTSQPCVLNRADSMQLNARFDAFGFCTVRNEAAVHALVRPATDLDLICAAGNVSLYDSVEVGSAWTDAVIAARHHSTSIRFLNELLQRQLNADEISECLNAFDLDTLEHWLFEPKSYATTAVECGFHQLLTPILKHVLRRHILQLRSSSDKDSFLRFWKSLCQAFGVAEVVELSCRYIDDLVVSSDQEISKVMDEEDSFGDKLRGLAAELTSSTPLVVFRSLAREIENIARERARPNRDQTVDVCFKTALIWKSPMASGSSLSAGIELPIKLCRREEADNPLFADETEVACSDDFRQNFEQVRQQIGADEWYPLKFLEYVGDDLVGCSGTLSVYTAQLLAKPNDQGRAYALPPYVVVCATCAKESRWEAAPVGRLSMKLRLLEVTGTRVIIVHSSQFQEARETLPASIHVLTHDGTAHTLSEKLKQLGLVWSCNVKHLQCHGKTTRRVWLSVAAAATAASGALGYCRRPANYQTQAMLKHERLRRDMLDMWIEIERHIDGRPTTYIDLLRLLNIPVPSIGVAKEVIFAKCESLGLHDVIEGDPQWNSTQQIMFQRLSETLRVPLAAIQIEAKPELRFESMGYSVEYDGKVYDHVGDGRTGGWKSLSSMGFDNTDLFERPIEPAFLTRSVRLRAKPDASRRIRFEFNTSGLGVIPLHRRSDKLSVFITRMSESRNALGLTHTLVIERTISDLSDGEELEEVVNGIYINGFQDQSLRDESFDWWGTRIQQGTKQADLSVAFPPDLLDLKIRRRERPEDGTWIELDNHPAIPGGEVIDGTRWITNEKHVWFSWNLPLPANWDKWRQENPDRKAIVFAILGGWKQTS